MSFRGTGVFADRAVCANEAPRREEAPAAGLSYVPVLPLFEDLRVVTRRTISRVAVANRGEAAVRFMRAARTWMRRREQHLSVVAMYTTPDAGASFVKMASSVVNLGDPFVTNAAGERKSVYVDVERIVAAAVDAGCDALWPGWGFLSESPELADACKREGVIFIGPSGDAMRQMGDKIAAKRLAEEANVPVSPWSRDPVRTAEEAVHHADAIGYPVLLKAAAGGGGRGIRRVDSAQEIAEQFRSAAAEAASAFGDDSIFVESFVTVARHIEVQILADEHGNVWALGTRDCSVQRRNQKVIEEAPAPGLEPDVEQALCEASIRMAKICGYVGAGTCEYLLLPDNRTFYFLEMNTRLQVEHTITEEIHGFDLVGAQIDIASGIPLREAPPTPRGVAVQARLNAEDPDDGFAPRSGLLTRFAVPQGPGVRVDSGYSPGTVVPSAFDSNIAKIICLGEDRDEAYARLQTALRDSIVALDSGLTNRSLLLELVGRSDVRRGPVTTGWLGQYLERRERPEERKHLTVAIAGAAIGDYLEERNGHRLQFFAESANGLPRRIPQPAPAEFRYRIGESSLAVRVAEMEPGVFRVTSGPWTATFQARFSDATTLILEYDGHRHSVIRVSLPGVIDIDVEGTAHRFMRSSDGKVRAQLPAAVTAVHVEVGQNVVMGDRLVTQEVMKMEMPVLAPLSGTIKAVHVVPASQVSTGDLLIEIEESADGSAAEVASEPVPLPSRPALPRDPVAVTRSWLLGFDVDPSELEAARELIRSGRSGATRGSMLSLLRAFVVGDQLFQSGPFDDAPNDARATTVEQLLWFLQHRRVDEDQLSDRFVRRLRRHFDLHGMPDYERGDASDFALLRLFQAHNRDPDEVVLVLLDVFAGLSNAVPTGDEELDESRGRVVFEKFANAAIQRGHVSLASAAWNLIFEWYDLPYQRNELKRFSREAVNALASLQQDATAPERRHELRDQLLSMPIGALLGGLPARFPATTSHGQRVLRILLERFYGAVDQDTIPSAVEGLHARRAWVDQGRSVAAILLPSAWEAERAAAAVPADIDEIDFIVAAPVEGEQLGALIASVRDVSRVSVLWGTADTGLRARTWRLRGGSLELDEQMHDLHPESPQARQIARYVNFELERLPTSGGLWLSRARARDNSGDERFLAVAEVEQFEIEQVGPTVRVPALETVYLNAVTRLREEIRRSEAKAPAWNRITLVIRPPAHITRAGLEALARRVGPSSLDLGIEKIVLVGRFSLDGEPLQEMAVEWSNPIGLGTRVTYTNIRLRPFVSLTELERSIIRARQRSLFYPYEIVGWLTSPGNRFGVDEGDFDEFDLDDDNRLVSVRGRAYGRNTANVVVGRISNRSTRFPDGIQRVLIIGDPTRTMGSLGEQECRRIIAAIEYAEEHNLPVEWVALSSGARISFDSGTENLDWTACVLRSIIEFTQRGGVIHCIVDGPCVGAQSYWNAEATMLMHCRGALIMTPRGYMVLTGKKALEYSGSVAAETNEKIGGLEIMEPNGQAQYTAPDLYSAYELLFKHYDLTYVAASEGYTRPFPSADPDDRDACETPYDGPGGFAKIGEIFNEEANPGRKKPFAIRPVIESLLDADSEPLERWRNLMSGETAVVYHGRMGGQPVCMVGIESVPVKRKDQSPVDGPDSWMSGTLFPHSSRKVARAINASSGVMPVVVVANLSGFDGSPESLRKRQLEFGAEIGRAVVNFQGPIVFCVVSRYHGGAYVVFSQGLNASLEAVALDGSYASVIGGAPAAAVVFPGMVRKRVMKDDRVRAARQALDEAPPEELAERQQRYDEVLRNVESEVQMQVAREFDSVHSVQRAMDVGSLTAVIQPAEIRRDLINRVRSGIARFRTP